MDWSLGGESLWARTGNALQQTRDLLATRFGQKIIEFRSIQKVGQKRSALQRHQAPRVEAALNSQTKQ